MREDSAGGVIGRIGLYDAREIGIEVSENRGGYEGFLKAAESGTVVGIEVKENVLFRKIYERENDIGESFYKATIEVCEAYKGSDVFYV